MERRRQGGLLVELHRDVARGLGAEAVEREGDRVGPRRQQGQPVGAVGVGGGRAHPRQRRPAGLDGHPRQGAAVLGGHPADDAARGLGGERSSEQQAEREQQQGKGAAPNAHHGLLGPAAGTPDGVWSRKRRDSIKPGARGSARRAGGERGATTLSRVTSVSACDLPLSRGNGWAAGGRMGEGDRGGEGPRSGKPPPGRRQAPPLHKQMPFSFGVGAELASARVGAFRTAAAGPAPRAAAAGRGRG